jgi:hypothetical protein
LLHFPEKGAESQGIPLGFPGSFDDFSSQQALDAHLPGR